MGMKRLLVFGCWIFSFITFSPIFAQDTESAGAGSTAAPGTVAWSNPNNITASDNSYATASNGTTQTITASNFGFALPSNAVIDGIEVSIERSGRASNNIAQDTWQTAVQPNFGVVGADVYDAITYSSINVGSGSNRLLLVVVAIENVDNTPTLDTDVDPVTVTYDGVNMTQIDNATLASATTRNWIGMFYLLETDLPVGGSTADLVVTKTRGATASVDDPEEYIEMVSINTFTNVNQTFPFSSVATTGNGNTITSGGALNVVQGDMVVAGATGNNPNHNFNAMGDGLTIQTNISENNNVTTGAAAVVGTRSITTTGVGTVTPSATGANGSGRLAMVAIVLQGARVFDNNVQLNKGGVATGNNLGNGNASIAVSWPETDATTTYGDPTELWGTTWNFSEINSADFGISLQADANNAQAFIDHIQITIYFTETLPIHLISFGVGYEAPVVKCKATIYIDDDKQYTVITERSKDGTDFQPIGQLDFDFGHPTTKTFEVVDEEPYSGLSYYRLKLIDHFVGDVNYSKVKTVFAGSTPVFDWKLYPNPTASVLVVEIPDFEEHIDFQLYNSVGKRVPFHITTQGGGRFLIEPKANSWDNGIYILEVVTTRQRFKSRFVVSQ